MSSADYAVRRRAKARRDAIKRILGYAAVIALIVVIMFPFLWLLTMSVKPKEDIFAFPPKVLFEPTIVHYTALWDTAFIRAFQNSTITSTVSTLLSLIVGVPAAYALSRARFRGEEQIALWILATRMAPPIAFTIPFFLAYRHLELLDTVTGLIIVYLTFNLSLVIWMMRTFFESVPRALEEAARIDGAGTWETFMRIVLPLSGPGLAATAIFCFLFSWNDFFYALILTRTQAMTAPVAVVNFMQYEGWEWGKIASGGTMVMLPVIIFSLIVRNYLVRGLTAGAVKG